MRARSVHTLAVLAALPSSAGRSCAQVLCNKIQVVANLHLHRNIGTFYAIGLRAIVAARKCRSAPFARAHRPRSARTSEVREAALPLCGGDSGSDNVCAARCRRPHHRAAACVSSVRDGRQPPPRRSERGLLRADRAVERAQLEARRLERLLGLAKAPLVLRVRARVHMHVCVCLRGEENTVVIMLRAD